MRKNKRQKTACQRKNSQRRSYWVLWGKRMTELKIQHNTPEWLEFRKKGIGSSDASCLFGTSNYKTNLELWREKVGLIEPKEVNNPYVNYGKAAEELLAKLFALDYPEYEFHFVKDTVYLHDNGYSFASLDGKLIEKATGKLGGFECKTAEIHSRRAEAEWAEDKIPMAYYIQVLHQFYVTGWDFWYLKAQLKQWKNGEVYLTTKHYKLEKKDHLEDIKMLAEKEAEFWGYVQRNEEPPFRLPNI